MRFDDNTVCLVCLRGYYDDFTKKTNTAFVFINQLGKPIKELHGEIRINVDSTYQKIYVAVDDKKYSFEYYFMNSAESADVVYQYAVTNLGDTYKDVENATILETEYFGLQRKCI